MKVSNADSTLPRNDISVNSPYLSMSNDQNNYKHGLCLAPQTGRTPSPGVGRYVTCPLAGGMAVASGLNATWVSTMDKYRITMGLELSLTLIASQGITHLMDHRLCQWEKQIIKREIGAEMVCTCI
jgi:hypothetical protein